MGAAWPFSIWPFQSASIGFVNTNNAMMDTEVHKQLLISYNMSEQFTKAHRLLPKAEAMIRKHYLNMMSEADAGAFWNVVPEAISVAA